MKKITFMMSLLLAMGSMTTSAQVLDRTGWKITTSGECDDSGLVTQMLLLMARTTRIGTRIGLARVKQIVQVTLPKNFLSFSKST